MATQLLLAHWDVEMRTASELRGIKRSHLLRLLIFGVVFALLFGWFLRLPFKRNEESFGSGTGRQIQFASTSESLPSGQWSGQQR